METATEKQNAGIVALAYAPPSGKSRIASWTPPGQFHDGFLVGMLVVLAIGYFV